MGSFNSKAPILTYSPPNISVLWVRYVFIRYYKRTSILVRINFLYVLGENKGSQRSLLEGGGGEALIPCKGLGFIWLLGNENKLKKQKKYSRGTLMKIPWTVLIKVCAHTPG